MRRFFNNFPFVKQKDAMQCGIASLSMICQYYGRKYSTSYLSEMCHATTEGVSMLGISETATQLGLIAMTAYVSPEDMLRKDVSLPAILHCESQGQVHRPERVNQCTCPYDPEVSTNDETKLIGVLKDNLNLAHTYNVQHTPSIIHNGIKLSTGVSLVDVLTQ